MPLSALAEAIIQPIAEIILQLACYGTGWLLVPAITLGKVYVEPTPLREFVKPKFGRLQKSPKGHYIMDAELGALIGMMFWIIAGVGAYVVYKYT
jgi:hypothetical protein